MQQVALRRDCRLCFLMPALLFTQRHANAKQVDSSVKQKGGIAARLLVVFKRARMLRDCVNLMAPLVPLVIETIMDNPDTHGGDAGYPEL